MSDSWYIHEPTSGGVATLARVAVPAPDHSAATLENTAEVHIDPARERAAVRLNRELFQRLFGIGLHLKATAQLADTRTRDRLEAAIETLDLAIVELRRAIFADVRG